jgi:hypothetical protein
MDSNLSNSILTVCKVLNKHSVQYMIVGGTAVALHGYFRQSLGNACLLKKTVYPDNEKQTKRATFFVALKFLY